MSVCDPWRRWRAASQVGDLGEGGVSMCGQPAPLPSRATDPEPPALPRARWAQRSTVSPDRSPSSINRFGNQADSLTSVCLLFPISWKSKEDSRVII